MRPEREIKELEDALARYVRRTDPQEAGAGALIRALPGALRRTGRSRIRYARKQRRARPIREERLAAATGHDWRSVTKPPLGRFEAMAGVVDGRLFALSGFGMGEQIQPDTFIYSPQGDRWSTGMPMPIGVTHAGAAVAGGTIWILGGFIGNHPGVATSKVQVYDPGADAWHEQAPLPVARGSLAAVESAGRIHVFGGTIPDRHTDAPDHFVCNPAESSDGWQAAAPLPLPRNHLGAAAIDGLVYAIGGQHGHDRGATDVSYVHAYDPAADRWERRADLPTPRNHCEAAVFDWEGHLFVAGGYDDFRDFAPHSSIVRYSPADDTWTEVGALPMPLVAPVFRIIDGIAVVTSGSPRLAGAPVSDTWIHADPSVWLPRQESGA